jgi:signal transduction histidine kinase
MLPPSMDVERQRVGSETSLPWRTRRPPKLVTRAVLSALFLSALIAAVALGVAAICLALFSNSGGVESVTRLLPLAALLIAASGLAGYAMGLGVQTEYRRVISILRTALLVRRSRSARGGDSSIAELDAFGEAVHRLEGRFFEDMTLYADALAEVEMMDGRKTDLLTAVATDLYGPLDRVVALSAQLLDDEGGPLDESKADDARIVRNAAERLREMVTEILDLSSLVSREVELVMTTVDLVAVARDVVETARGQIADKRLAIRLSEPGRPVEIEGHRQRLWQVVMNLLGNAIKFTEEGSIVVTVSARDDGGARLEVLDTGIGIASRDQLTIFDTFKQLGGRVSRGRGTGLGLAITRRIVELHGGRITVSSVVNQGTRFTVAFPSPRRAP